MESTEEYYEKWESLEYIEQMRMLYNLYQQSIDYVVNKSADIVGCLAKLDGLQYLGYYAPEVMDVLNNGVEVTDEFIMQETGVSLNNWRLWFWMVADDAMKFKLNGINLNGLFNIRNSALKCVADINDDKFYKISNKCKNVCDEVNNELNYMGQSKVSIVPRMKYDRLLTVKGEIEDIAKSVNVKLELWNDSVEEPDIRAFYQLYYEYKEMVGLIHLQEIKVPVDADRIVFDKAMDKGLKSLLDASVVDVSEKQELHKINDIFQTPEVVELFQKAINAGYLNNNYSVNSSKIGVTNAQIAYIGQYIKDKVPQITWGMLERLWGIRNLSQIRGNSRDKVGKVRGGDEIDEIYK